MDFSLNQEQEMFREFLQKYINDMENTQITRDYIENKIDKVQQVLGGIHELGCAQLNIPEIYGGKIGRAHV